MVSVTLNEIRRERGPYPSKLLRGCENALILFAAGFHGEHDGIYVHDAGMTATCVDVNETLLSEMRDVYPPDWEWVLGDAYNFALKTNRTWDIVSVDPPSNGFLLCGHLMPLWCRLARKAVIVATGWEQEVTVPEGWKFKEVIHRSSFLGGVYWTVVVPE